MKFIVEKVANMVFITSDCGTVFNAWDECEFTERKLGNAMRKIEKNYCGKVVIVGLIRGCLSCFFYLQLQ